MEVRRYCSLQHLCWFQLAAIAFGIFGVAHSGSIRPAATLIIMPGEGFIAYLEATKSFGAISNCAFRHEDEVESTRLALNASQPIITKRGEQVLPYAFDVCGIRVSEVSAASGGRWHLEMSNAEGDEELDSLMLSVLQSHRPPAETRVKRSLGRGSITCSTHDTYNKHCHIVDRSTGEHWPNTCSLTTLLRANSSFECRTYDWGRMTAARELILVDLVGQDVLLANVQATQQESNASIQLGCQFNDATYACLAAPPHSNAPQLLLMDGLYNGRYATANTLLASSNCVLELPKPLQADELGLWRIYNYNTNPPSGCLYYVGSAPAQIIEAELDKLNVGTAAKRQVKVYYSLGDTIPSLECLLPFPVQDCYLRSPRNDIYFLAEQDRRRGATYGLCVFRRLPIQEGLWRCGARGSSYDKEVTQDIEVLVESRAGVVPEFEINVRSSESAQLLCRSAFDEPIARCLFVGPDKNVYIVATSNNVQTTGHVRYHGRGVDYGDCGIQIDSVKESDFGYWRCQFGLLGSQGADSDFSLEIRRSGGSQATIASLCIVLVLVKMLLI